MALTSTDQYWGEKLKIVQQETEQAQAENAQLKLMIGAAKPGQSPGDDRTKEPYDKDWPPPAPLAPKLAGLQINPNSIMLPFVPKDAETDEDYGEGAVPGHPDWKMAHGEGRGPQPLYHDEYNRPLDMPPWIQMFPDGKMREIPWMKEQYLQEHPELADHRGLTNYLDSKGRSGRTGSFKGSGLSQEELIKALKIGLQVMKA